MIFLIICIDDEKIYIHVKYMDENTSMRTFTEETILMIRMNPCVELAD